jgi:hypothetical protein
LTKRKKTSKMHDTGIYTRVAFLHFNNIIGI